ncbi:MAG: tRNA uridine-5-carboxymethylaminomethyl(34) synthesis GTPase MnmE [Xanthomonadaceae bacterium]|nr:tRNA uridine-5-carboxymethylaminomethyl(34) synthesis GTPase MnmE [Xanthomonadaceae bacterium]
MSKHERSHHETTIAAIATAAGSGGVGVIRLSGPNASTIAQALCGMSLKPRYAHYARFRDEHGDTIDDGIALYFRAPASYTGEDVVELQAHGSPAVLRALLDRCCALGARLARAGEFSERAFLNGKLDLAQAEAVADLIAAADQRAARAARRSLDGVFSQRVDALAAVLLRLRVHVEATIDFVDESIETLGGSAIETGLAQTENDLDALLREAERGQKLRDGLHAVIVGPPNAGKSSLLNALAGSDRAIVSDIAGTTRDVLRETVRVDGLELTLVDTAGLRAGGDAIEREGMRRAEGELRRADLAIVVLDAQDIEAGRAAVADAIADVPQRLWVANKADLLEFQGSAPTPNASTTSIAASDMLWVSARTGAGLETLHARLAAVGGIGEGVEGAFSARARQVDALRRAQTALAEARDRMREGAYELTAEALRAAHDALGEITGRIAPDDLLGHIFSTFCIGK